jgi:hypothetical protein
VIRLAALVLAALVPMAAAALAAEPAALLADADYVSGLDAYERAVAADAIGRGDDAGRLLREARASLDAAIAGYRAALAADPGRDDARRRLAESLAVGRPCCGKRSLWVAYGVRSEPR